MPTMYLRNVPEAVRDRLQILADREGISVSAFALRELAAVSRRADNPELLSDLPDSRIDVSSVLEGLDAGRTGR